LIGLSIAAPVGAIGVLVIRRSLVEGGLNGFVSGLGAATADGFYGCIAAFGLSALSSILIDNSLPIRIVGMIFLFYLGIKTLISKPAEKAAEAKSNNTLLSAYFSTLLLTITNPITIISFLGIFAGLGADTVRDTTGAVVMVFGVFLGSAIWWLVLSLGVSLLRERISPNLMLWINRISGLVIIYFALSILWTLLFPA
jgi:threonine/homoserine/homoserine lactone efflux protein